jgi:ATP-dependent metalloprotease
LTPKFQAAVKASKEHCALVDKHHLEWARDKILMGAERKSAVVTDEVGAGLLLSSLSFFPDFVLFLQSKRKTAYHEGGHALVALYTKGSLPLHRVTCIPRGVSLGMVCGNNS